MLRRLHISVLILCVFLLTEVHSQNQNEITSLRDAMNSGSQKINYTIARDNHNEIQFVFSRLFLFYKTFISSQDMQRCVFTPSCSEYAIQALKQQGIIIGTLNAFDRLSRCNALSPEEYELDEQVNKFKDPL
jgi:putative membrane protein insertion efficiency factor